MELEEKTKEIRGQSELTLQQPCNPAYTQGQVSQNSGYAQEQTPKNSGYATGQAPQNVPVQTHQLIRPNGKRCFSARTVVYPIVFIVVHALTQLLVGVLAVISYFAGDSSPSLADITPDTTLDFIQELVKAIGIPVLLYSALLQIIICVIFLWYQKRKNPEYLLMRPPHITAFPLGFATAFGCLGIATLLLQLFDVFAKNSSFGQSMMVNYHQSAEALQGVDLLLTTLGIAVLSPVAEELLFRGIITEEIRQVAPDWLTILAGGVIFALVHGNPVQILYVLPLGFLLGASYIWTNSIWVPILIHVVFNFFGSIFWMQIGENETVLTVYKIFLFAMIPVGIISAFVMNRMYRKNKKVVAEKSGGEYNCVNTI